MPKGKYRAAAARRREAQEVAIAARNADADRDRLRREQEAAEQKAEAARLLAEVCRLTALAESALSEQKQALTHEIAELEAVIRSTKSTKRELNDNHHRHSQLAAALGIPVEVLLLEAINEVDDKEHIVNLTGNSRLPLEGVAAVMNARRSAWSPAQIARARRAAQNQE